jgi:hypothetical protein
VAGCLGQPREHRLDEQPQLCDPLVDECVGVLRAELRRRLREERLEQVLRRGDEQHVAPRLRVERRRGIEDLLAELVERARDRPRGDPRLVERLRQQRRQQVEVEGRHDPERRRVGPVGAEELRSRRAPRRDLGRRRCRHAASSR